MFVHNWPGKDDQQGKVAYQDASPGAKSDVYDCLVFCLLCACSVVIRVMYISVDASLLATSLLRWCASKTYFYQFA